MRVLAVLYCYPPLLVPASICYLKVVAGLRAAGVDVEILTIRPDSFLSPGPIPLDESLETVLPEGVENHAVRSPERSPALKLVKRLDPKRRFTWRWLEPKKREWLGPARRHLDREDLGRFDVLLTCSQPHANHLLGLDLKRRLGLPWVAYFSDPWTDNPYAWWPLEKVRRHHRRLEDGVLREADAVLYTCDEMRDLVLSRHDALEADRTGVLPHAFVPEWYAPGGDGQGEGVADGESREKDDDTALPHAGEAAGPSRRADGDATRPRFRLLQTGSFYGPRSSRPILEALEAVARKRDLDGLVQVDSYGGMPDDQKRAIADKGLGEVFRVHGFIPYLETLRLMGTHDALLLVDAPLTSTEESVFLPSKLVDYLGSGQPILALTPSRGTTARVIRECGGTICPLEEPEVAARTLARALEEGFEALRPRREAAARYDYGRVGRSLAGVLERTAGGVSATRAGEGTA